ncbi:hypothetical protein HpBGD90_06000 [Helicobacter pylori]
MSLDTDGIVLPHNVFIAICYSILNNFCILLANLILISLTILRLRDFALKYPQQSESRRISGYGFVFIYP